MILNFGGATKKKSKQPDFSSESNLVEFDFLNVMNVIILGRGNAEVVGKHGYSMRERSWLLIHLLQFY